MIKQEGGFRADKCLNFMTVVVICEQFLTARKQPSGVTVDHYLSTSA